MKSHELAHELLKLPDVDVIYDSYQDMQAPSGGQWDEVLAVHYDERQRKVLLV